MIPFEFKAIAALLLVVGLLLGARYEIGKHDANVIAVLEAKATEAARAEEQRRTAAQSEVNDETQRLAAHDADARVLAAGAARGLSDRTAALLAGVPSCPATGLVGPPAPSAADLLADVQRGLLEAGGQLAAEADKRRTPGLGAERKYDSLTVKP